MSAEDIQVEPRWISVYVLLVGLAAESTRPISYGQLATILRVMQGRGCHRRHVGGMLRKVTEHTTFKGEPDLTAYVVGKDDKPGVGWPGWKLGSDPVLARKTAHAYFREEVWG